MEAMKLEKHEGRTILTHDGAPVRVWLQMREATTAPARIKAVLAVSMEDDEGVTHAVPMPFTYTSRKPTFEFRLEMN